MKVTNVRLITAVLTFFLGVMLVNLTDGIVRPLLSDDPELTEHCWH